VSVPGITGNDMPIVDVIIFNTFDTATALATIAAWAKVGRITTDANSITAYCYEDFPPDIALSMVLVVIS
jgi:hypothetical protein